MTSDPAEMVSINSICCVLYKVLSLNINIEQGAFSTAQDTSRQVYKSLLALQYRQINSITRFDDIQAILICTWEGVPLINGNAFLSFVTKSDTAIS